MPIVLGGGISGLSYAYYLSRAMPSARIVLVEKSARVGGWVQTDKTCNDCIFEAGPRTLRPVGEAGAITLELVSQFGIYSKY